MLLGTFIRRTASSTRIFWHSVVDLSRLNRILEASVADPVLSSNGIVAIGVVYCAMPAASASLSIPSRASSRSFTCILDATIVGLHLSHPLSRLLLTYKRKVLRFYPYYLPVHLVVDFDGAA